MALAVSLLFDRETTSAVEAVWAAIAHAGVSRDMIDLNYPPHVTLVVVDDEAWEAQLSEALAVGALQARMNMTLGPAKMFEGTNVSWLACEGGPSLLSLHKAVCEVVPLEAIRPYYRPGQWTPHMTLQTLGDPAAGRELANALWRSPREAQAIRLELARFLPVVRLGGVDLTY